MCIVAGNGANCLYSGLPVSPPAGGPPAARSAKMGTARLAALQGARFLCSLWVVLKHATWQVGRDSHCSFDVSTDSMTQDHHKVNGPWTPLTLWMFRSGIAVVFFAHLSGFVTHWAYADKRMYSHLGAVLQYYVRRIGRVVVSTLIALAIMWCPASTATMEMPTARHVRCFTMVEAWGYWPLGTNGLAWLPWSAAPCANPVIWTIASMVPGWLLYPATQKVLRLVEAAGGLFGLIVSWGLLFGCVMGMCAVSASSFSPRTFLYRSPIAITLHMVMGSVTAAMSRRHAPRVNEATSAISESTPLTSPAPLPNQEPGASKLRRCWIHAAAALSDVCALGLCVLSLTPHPTSSVQPVDGCRAGYEVFILHASAPLLDGFMYGYAVAASLGGRPVHERLLGHPALSSLGNYTFGIYLFQFRIIEWWLLVVPDGDEENSQLLGPAALVVYLASLLTFAGAYTIYLEEPFARRVLGQITKGWESKRIWSTSGVRCLDRSKHRNTSGV